jgi:GT2 family glycosyltransferase
MTIFAVIPVYNRKLTTRDCLLSLSKQNSPSFRAIVVDDGSTDGTSKMIADEFPEVVLLHGNGNLWWTGAMNKGIRHVLGICNPEDYVLALNDDLIVPKEYISALTKLAINFPNTLIGSVITDINDRDTILSGGIKINWRNAKRFNLDVGKKRSSFPEGYYNEVSTLTGRGVLIPVRVFRENGLYNELHYKHYGDTELPKRAEKAGYRLIVGYDAIVYSYPLRELSGEKYRLSDLGKYFWNIRSNTNLRVRLWLAYDTTSSILQGTIYLLFDLARITFHFIRRLRL